MKHRLLLCACICALLLTGCGGDGSSAAETETKEGSLPADTAVEETSEPTYLDTLGTKDFNNAVFS